MGKRILKSLIFSVCLLLCLAGCERDEGKKAEGDVVMKFAGKNITLGEVFIYANTISEQYVKSYGENVWDMNVPVAENKTENMEDVTRRDIIEDIVRVKVLCAYANNYNISLTAEEEDKIKRNAEAFYKNLTDEQIEKMQLDRDIVKMVYRENEIAARVYDEVVNRAGIEVSDEDARQTTFYDLVFENYMIDAEGNVRELSEDDRNAQYERALQAYNTLVNPVSGADNTKIEGLAEFYGASDSRYYTLSPAEIEEMYGTEIKDMIYSLEDGSYSLVTESEYGYHIFYVKALTDREATDKLKNSEISTKEKAYFAEYYKKWLKETDPTYSYDRSVDQDVYKKIKF